LRSISLGLCDIGNNLAGTTFRPEMLSQTEKCYGVTYHNKVSKIACVTKEKALEFIEDAAGN
jgi:structural maintenance of chromosome 3 (chondroitin sulfate proteoglycan 6)